MLADEGKSTELNECSDESIGRSSFKLMTLSSNEDALMLLDDSSAMCQ